MNEEFFVQHLQVMWEKHPWARCTHDGQSVSHVFVLDTERTPSLHFDCCGCSIAHGCFSHKFYSYKEFTQGNFTFIFFGQMKLIHCKGIWMVGER